MFVIGEHRAVFGGHEVWRSPSAPTSMRWRTRASGCRGARLRPPCRSPVRSSARYPPDADVDARHQAMRARTYVVAAMDAARAAPTPRRATPPGAVELMIPVVKDGIPRWRRASPRTASRFTEEWASSRRPAPRSSIATRGSSPSTRAHRYPGQRPHRAQDRTRRRARCPSGGGGDEEGGRALSRQRRARGHRGATRERRATLDEAVQWVASISPPIRTRCTPGRSLPRAVEHGRRRLADGPRGASRRRQLASGAADPAFCRAKITTARFLLDYLLTQADALKRTMAAGRE